MAAVLPEGWGCGNCESGLSVQGRGTNTSPLFRGRMIVGKTIVTNVTRV